MSFHFAVSLHRDIPFSIVCTGPNGRNSNGLINCAAIAGNCAVIVRAPEASMVKAIRKAVWFGLMLVPFAGIQAGQVNGTVNVSLQVRSGCQVGGGPVGADFGALDFGTRGPTWSEPLTTDTRPSGSGPLHVVCSPDIGGFLVSVDEGRHGLQSTRYLVRRDAAGRSVARVPYNIYRDPARSVAYVPQIPQSFRVDERRDAVALPLFGVVGTQMQFVPAGTYEDLLGITVNW
ncbi:spore coat U domain-containing protein [Burkholderia sp. AU30198]|nr:spore coat U domain-containing protein [Burkholderia sp. AU30198]